MFMSENMVDFFDRGGGGGGGIITVTKKSEGDNET